MTSILKDPRAFVRERMQALREGNDCHDPGDGKFCSGGGGEPKTAPPGTTITPRWLGGKKGDDAQGPKDTRGPTLKAIDAIKGGSEEPIRQAFRAAMAKDPALAKNLGVKPAKSGGSYLDRITQANQGGSDAADLVKTGRVGGKQPSTEVQTAFSDWLNGRAFVRNGSFYLHSERKQALAKSPLVRPELSGRPKLAPWNKTIKKMFGALTLGTGSDEFHKAAHAWAKANRSGSSVRGIGEANDCHEPHSGQFCTTGADYQHKAVAATKQPAPTRPASPDQFSGNVADLAKFIPKGFALAFDGGASGEESGSLRRSGSKWEVWDQQHPDIPGSWSPVDAKTAAKIVRDVTGRYWNYHVFRDTPDQTRQSTKRFIQGGSGVFDQTRVKAGLTERPSYYDSPRRMKRRWSKTRKNESADLSKVESMLKDPGAFVRGILEKTKGSACCAACAHGKGTCDGKKHPPM